MKIKKRRRQKRERKKEDESIKQNNGRSDSMDIDKDNEFLISILEQYQKI